MTVPSDRSSVSPSTTDVTLRAVRVIVVGGVVVVVVVVTTTVVVGATVVATTVVAATVVGSCVAGVVLAAVLPPHAVSAITAPSVIALMFTDLLQSCCGGSK
jgi:hypothetical protein